MAGNAHKAVWSHPARDYRTGKESVRPMVDRLAEAGFELIIPCLRSGGPVSYRSKIAHVDEWCKGWDPLAVLAEEANRAGLQVHAWLCTFRESEGSALVENRRDLSARDPEGKQQDWACPRSQETQDYEFLLYKELMDYDIAGVHLDYIRYGGRDSCYCSRCRNAFGEAFGVDPARLEWGDALWGEWMAFRAEPVTRFVRRLRKATQELKKALSAAVFPDYPGCFVSVGQDWVDWVEKDLLDLLIPMNYTASRKVAHRRTEIHRAFAKSRVPLWEGLGKSSHASYLPTRYLEDQAKAVLEAGAEGICIFSHGALLDEDLEALKDL